MGKVLYFDIVAVTVILLVKFVLIGISAGERHEFPTFIMVSKRIHDYGSLFMPYV